MTIRVLFILKERDYLYSDEHQNKTYGLLNSGLFNSANFVNEMLNHVDGFKSHIVHVVDNNSIDREVTKFKPNVVIIEAYWVVPSKFAILQKLHPHVKWVIRNHSKIPFLASEGIAMQWTLQYLQYKNVFVSSNAPDTNRDIKLLAAISPWNEYPLINKTPYLPNYYPINTIHAMRHPKAIRDKNVLKVGCFGAIRPLKNQLEQAVAAIKYCVKHKLELEFHINATRLEMNGGPVYSNIVALFANIGPQFRLIEHSWSKHHQFLKLVSEMDIVCQVTYSETFNIVGCDAVSQDVAVIGASDIPWLPRLLKADCNNTNDIVAKMHTALFYNKFNWYRRYLRCKLAKYSALSKKLWINELKYICEST